MGSYQHEFKLRAAVLSNLAQILTSCSNMNVKSVDIRNISQFTEAYFILCMEGTYFTSFCNTTLTLQHYNTTKL